MDLQRGSEWHKWDFHLHTPSSYDYGNKGITNEKIIENLISKNITVVVISDHQNRFISNRKFENIAKGRVIILPGIEFRSELGGRESVHFIGIFPED